MFIFSSACLGLAAVYVWAEWNGWRPVARLTKAAASTSFVVLAIINGAADSTYGVLILAALVLSWFGDMLLLSLRSEFLLGGIATFLAAHLAYAVAFGILSLEPASFVIALALLNASVLFILRWLWPHLDRLYRIACRFIWRL